MNSLGIKSEATGQHNRLSWLLIAGLTMVMVVGCSRSDQVIGVAHSGNQTPIFYQGNQPGSAATNSSRTQPQSKLPTESKLQTESLEKLARMPFLHNDHFGLLTIRPTGFKELESRVSRDLKLTKSLEQWLAPMIGTANSKLDSIERIWLLLDREGFDLMSIDQMPVVWIIEFRDSVVWDPTDIPLGRETAETGFTDTQNPPSSSPSLPSTDPNPVKLAHRILGPHRLAIGSPGQLEKLEAPVQPQASLVERLNLINEQSEISGLLVLEPIQRPLEQTLGLLSRFGDQARSIANLPEQIRSFSFQFSVFDQTIVSASLEAKDEKNAEDLLLMMSGLTSLVENLGSFNGFNGDSGRGSSDLDSPIVLRVNGVLEEIGAEIKAKSLTQIEQSGRMLQISLQRPSQSDQLVSAISEDFLANQFLDSRQQKLQQIADGLAKFEKSRGHLPHLTSEPVEEDAETVDGLAFNWRVAILPFIGEQDLYDQFDFQQPWDSPKNLTVAQRMPQIFESFDDRNWETPLMRPAGSADTPVPATRWHAAFGPSAAYRSDRNQPALADLKDQKIRTALILEGDLDSAIPWTAPTVFDLQGWPVERFGREGENGLLLIDANFEARLLKKNEDFLRILLDSEKNPALPRNAFFR